MTHLSGKEKLSQKIHHQTATWNKATWPLLAAREAGKVRRWISESPWMFHDPLLAADAQVHPGICSQRRGWMLGRDLIVSCMALSLTLTCHCSGKQRWLLWTFLCRMESVCMHAKMLQPCLILCNPMDCSPPVSSVHGDYPGENTGVGCCALLQQIFSHPGIEPTSPASPALQLDHLPLS